MFGVSVLIPVISVLALYQSRSPCIQFEDPSHQTSLRKRASIALKTILFPWAIRVFCCLLFLVWQNLMALLQTRVCFVVHKNDLGHTFVRKPPPNVHIITCAQHWETAVTEIQSCGFVASSSLHGIVVADALSIPRLWFQFNDTSTIRTEGNFKYQDYLQSIGHMNARPIRNVTFIEDTTKYSNVLTQSELQAIINQTSASFPYHLFHT